MYPLKEETINIAGVKTKVEKLPSGVIKFEPEPESLQQATEELKIRLMEFIHGRAHKLAMAAISDSELISLRNRIDEEFWARGLYSKPAISPEVLGDGYDRS